MVASGLTMTSTQVAALLCAIETPAERKHAFLVTLSVTTLPLEPDDSAAQEKYVEWAVGGVVVGGGGLASLPFLRPPHRYCRHRHRHRHRHRRCRRRRHHRNVVTIAPLTIGPRHHRPTSPSGPRYWPSKFFESKAFGSLASKCSNALQRGPELEAILSEVRDHGNAASEILAAAKEQVRESTLRFLGRRPDAPPPSRPPPPGRSGSGPPRTTSYTRATTSAPPPSPSALALRPWRSWRL